MLELEGLLTSKTKKDLLVYTRSFNVKVRQSDLKAVIVGRILSYRKLGLTSGIADDDDAEASGVLLSEQERLKLESLPSFFCRW